MTLHIEKRVACGARAAVALAMTLGLGCTTSTGDTDDGVKGGQGGDAKGQGGDGKGQGGASAGSGGAASGGSGGASVNTGGASAGGAGGGSTGGGGGGGQAGKGGAGGAGATAGGGGSPITDPPPQFSPVMLTKDMVTKLKVTNIAVDLGNIDGPLWDAQTQTLLLYRFDNNSMIRFTPGANTIAPFATPAPGVSAWDENGNLVTAANKKLSRIKRTGELIETLAPVQGGSAAGPTDVIVRRDGNIYFVDVIGQTRRVLRYGLDKRVSVIGAQAEPQGITFTLDWKSLLVSDVVGKNLIKYTLDDGGSKVGDSVVWGTANGLTNHNGVCNDYAGHIFLISHNGVLIFAPDGTYLERASPPAYNNVYIGNPNDCSFGGKDQKTLFVAGSKRDGSIIGLFTIDMPNPGPP